MSSRGGSGSVRNDNWVKYKFKSALDYSTASFTGNYISVADLRRQIIQDNRLQNPDYVLQITNEDTKHVYSESEQTLIPAKTLLTVVRVPKTMDTEVAETAEHASMGSQAAADSSRKRKVEHLYEQPNLDNGNNGNAWGWNGGDAAAGSYGNNGHGQLSYGYVDNGMSFPMPNPNYEEDYQNYGDSFYPSYGSGQNYEVSCRSYNSEYSMEDFVGLEVPPADGHMQSNLVEVPQQNLPEDPNTNTGVPRKRSTSACENDRGTLVIVQQSDVTIGSGRVPANYRCFKCNTPGHWIRDCPSEYSQEFLAVQGRRTTGIPRSSLIFVDDANVKGAMLTPDGRYAVSAVDMEAHQSNKVSNLVEIPQTPPENPNRWVPRKRSASTVEHDSAGLNGVPVPEKESKVPSKNRPPLSYTCYTCNKPGHWQVACPDSEQMKYNRRRATGIPRSSLVLVDDGNAKGAMLTPEGRYAIPVVEMEAYQAQSESFWSRRRSGP